MAPSWLTARKERATDVSAPSIAAAVERRMRRPLPRDLPGRTPARARRRWCAPSCRGSAYGSGSIPTYMLLEPYELAGWNIAHLEFLSAEIGRTGLETWGCAIGSPAGAGAGRVAGERLGGGCRARRDSCHEFGARRSIGRVQCAHGAWAALIAGARARCAQRLTTVSKMRCDQAAGIPFICIEKATATRRTLPVRGHGFAPRRTRRQLCGGRAASRRGSARDACLGGLVSRIDVMYADVAVAFQYQMNGYWQLDRTAS